MVLNFCLAIQRRFKNECGNSRICQRNADHKIFGVTVQYYKTLINSIKEYKQYVYQYSLSCKNPYVGFQVLFNVFYAFAVPAAVVFISYGEPAMLTLAKIVFFAVFSGAVFTSFTSIMFTGQDNFGTQNTLNQLMS